MQGALSAASRRALSALALALATHPASALEMGEIEVRSALGEALDARVPLVPADGESFDASCFTLLRGSDAAAPTLGEGILTIDLNTDGPALRIRSTARIFEPAIAVHLRFACAGQSAQREGRFAVLLDPRPGSQIVTDIPTIAATMHAAPGDTLASFANRVFPNERGARAQYLRALREANPAFVKQGDNEPLPEGAAVALPDLRTYARSASSTPRARAARTAVAPKQAVPKAAAAARPVEQRPAPVPRPREQKAADSKPDPRQLEARRTAQPHTGTPFVLRLSSADVDMSRSRGIDDRMRAQLRERFLVLDADDQVAALLSLRNSVRQLESRVAELQLKLATAAPALAQSAPAQAKAGPAPKAEPPARMVPKVEVPPSLPSTVDQPKAEVAIAEAPKVAAAPVGSGKVELAKTEVAKVDAATAEAPKVETPKVEAAKVEAPKPAPASPRPTAPPASDSRVDGVPNAWLIGGVAGLLLLLAALALWSSRRRERNLADDSDHRADPRDQLRPAERAFDDDDALTAVAAESGLAARPALASDAGLSTRLPENSRELRRRYIEERFPEIANRTLILEDPASVVKAARLYYEDGALMRAVELLQFCIEDNPQEVRTWLALFEIFRLERLSGEFADLARRFHHHHSNTGYWRKVQYFGREIDPDNLLYREDTINTLETIAPAQARQIAAANFDPIAENWLDAPMDFENEVLANELRQALMAQANLSEGDLIPNPMPALRNVEMFTVA